MHDTVSLSVASLSLYFCTEHHHTAEGLIFALGMASSLYLSCDLDQSYSMATVRWNRINPLLRFWWKGYDKLTHHRGRSHIPVIGTLSRLLWLSIPIILSVILIQVLGLLPGTSREWHYIILSMSSAMALPFFLWLSGLILADTLHALLDYLDSLIKKTIRASK